MNAFEIIGRLTLLLGAGGFFIVGLVILFGIAEVGLERYRIWAVRKENGRVGRNIFNQSYWFSEDDPTMYLIENIGKSLEKFGDWNAGDFRDEWRKQRMEVLADRKHATSGGG